MLKQLTITEHPPPYCYYGVCASDRTGVTSATLDSSDDEPEISTRSGAFDVRAHQQSHSNTDN
eukprot:5086137-Pyramimonas_sp.AAC.2